MRYEKSRCAVSIAVGLPVGLAMGVAVDVDVDLAAVPATGVAVDAAVGLDADMVVGLARWMLPEGLPRLFTAAIARGYDHGC